MGSQANRKSVSFAVSDESVHAKLCAMALATATQGEAVLDIKLFMCPECAHIEPDRAPACCPVCDTPAEAFLPV